MADKKISDFTAAGPLAAGDLFEIENVAGNSRKLTVAQGAAFANTTGGTSFPGSPASGDRFLRTDRNIRYYYDGTRWLSEGTYITTALLPIAGLTASGQINAVPLPFGGAYDVFVLDFIANTQQSATAVWTFDLYKFDAASFSLIATTSTSGDTTGNYTVHRVNLNAPVTSAHDALQINVIKTSGTGTLYAGFTITYRLIG